jgi:hypothetical protein
VIKLTDNTENKPTKHNILYGALAEVGTRHNREKVIFYFSGHAEIDKNGRFYLVPQDASGTPLSYISSHDLEDYVENMNNLAIIIDACNSGGFDVNLGKGQLLLTSSGKDEPSNEEWPGSFSVFTYQLCNAIREERQQDANIMLQMCFFRARDATIQWSRERMLRQTPSMSMTDTTGPFYLS